MMFIFLIVEGCWMIWQYEALLGVASASARCMAVGSSSCATVSATVNYATALASTLGVTVPTAGVTALTGISCGGVGGMDQVSIVLPVTNMAGGLLPMIPSNLSVASCFPVSP